MFLFCSNQVELAVFKYFVCTNKLLVQSLVYKYQKVVKLNFLFSPFRSHIDTKMYLHGFKERMFSIQEQCTWIVFSVYKYVIEH